jgi:hypothetical protein
VWGKQLLQAWGEALPSSTRLRRRSGFVVAKAGARVTLGKSSEEKFNPNGVAPVDRSQAATPSGLREMYELVPRVGAMRQPWALGRNPFGILGFSRLKICVMFRRSRRFSAK